MKKLFATFAVAGLLVAGSTTVFAMDTTTTSTENKTEITCTNPECPNDGICINGGECPVDGTGLRMGRGRGRGRIANGGTCSNAENCPNNGERPMDGTGFRGGRIN